MDNAAILEELQQLSETKSSDARRQLLHRITDLFETTSDNQDSSHRDAFDDIMDRIAYQLEASVRAEFSDRLADLANAPQKLSQKLALDEIEVARPMLQKSKILSDEFLVKVAETQSQDHLMAIASRSEINVRVTDALVNRGNPRVLENVSSNKGASFSRNAFEILTARADENTTLNDILEGRRDTPDDLMEIVKKRVEDKIAEEAKDAGISISSEEIKSTVENKSAFIELSDAEKEAAFQEIDYLHKRKQLDERVVLHYVKLNKVPEAIYSLTLMTNLEENVVRHCLLQAELPALAVLCKSNGFQRSTFATLLQLRENLSGIGGNQVIDAIRRYETLDLETAQRVMRFLKVKNAAKPAPNDEDSEAGQPDEESKAAAGTRMTAASG